MMYFSARHFLLIPAAALFLSSCMGTQNPAPYQHFGLYGDAGAGSAGVHTVTQDENLWAIAQRYNLSMQDIIYVNKLSAPYGLAKGQRLSLPPPSSYRVREDDTLYSVSRTFNVSQTQLARLNSLSAPYVVQVGQILHLPSVRSPPPRPMPQRLAAAVKSSRQNAVIRPSEKSEAKRKMAPAAAVSLRTPPRAGSKFMWPVDGAVISSYGPKKGGLHNDGVNIRAPKGAPVRAADNGTIVYAGNELKGFGNLVLVRHADRWMTAYAHMDRMLVKKGQEVRQGDSVGVVGSTGSVDTPQLHFETRRGTDALNPEIYLAKRGS